MRWLQKKKDKFIKRCFRLFPEQGNAAAFHQKKKFFSSP